MISLHSILHYNRNATITMITFDDFVSLQALTARQFSLTPECTKPKGQKLSHGTHVQRHVGDQTHTLSKRFSLRI